MFSDHVMCAKDHKDQHFLPKDSINQACLGKRHKKLLISLQYKDRITTGG